MHKILMAAVGACALAGFAETAFDVGADLRVREEVMDNVPGLPGAPGAMSRAKAGASKNQMRFRSRVWGKLDLDESFRLYARVADEVRWYATPKHSRSYAWPDEVVLDNLWFEGCECFGGLMDFRIGRQDLFDGRHSVFGLDRVMLDGAPYVGSRSCYADMIRTMFHVTEASKLDIFALYDKARNVFRVGTDRSRNRPMNAIHPGDSCEMDEWGGGAVWHSRLHEFLPYKLYAVHKHNEAYTHPTLGRMGDKQITTFGAEIEPQITDQWSLDFDVAKQVGRKNGGGQAGGYMGYGAVDFHPAVRAWKPFTRLSAYYLSGDKDRTGADDGDAAWDPMWARAPCDSEMMQYGTLYGLGYWSNMFHPKWTAGAGFGPHHAVSVSTGPMFAAVQDHLGHADGSGGSLYRGLLSAVRYDFPLWLAPEGAKGVDCFEVFGHVLAELFNPGDYFDTDKPAWFVRWEVTFKF